jgi:D-alanyl-lipoteichoic acid acyltransferase DltB (MBOAT superfamily)
MADFWQRWHITLGRWLRDYLYFPLGGSRKGEARAYGSLMLTMILCGLWHGAGLTYLVWGALQGVALCFYRWWRRRAGSFHLPTWAAWTVTFAFVIAVRVIFAADDLSGALRYLWGMVTFQSGLMPDPWVSIAVVLMIAGQWTGIESAFRRIALAAPARRLVTYGAAASLVIVLFPTVTPAFIYFEF